MRNVPLLCVQHANNNEASCDNTTCTANRRSAESVGHYQFVKCYHMSFFMSYGSRLPDRLSPLMYLCNFLLITITPRLLELTDSPCHLFLWVHPHCITSTYMYFPAHVCICCHLYIYYTKIFYQSCDNWVLCVDAYNELDGLLTVKMGSIYRGRRFSG
jgi:hypothetical protein